MSVASTIAAYTVPLLQSKLKREEQKEASANKIGEIGAEGSQVRETEGRKTTELYKRLGATVGGAAAGGFAAGFGKEWAKQLGGKKSDNNDKNNNTPKPTGLTRTPYKPGYAPVETGPDKSIDIGPWASQPKLQQKFGSVELRQGKEAQHNTNVMYTPQPNSLLPALGAGVGVMTHLAPVLAL